MSRVTSVFLIGATGYIGGAVLVALKKAYPNFSYSALVRSEKDVAAVQALGVSVVFGSTDNHSLIIDTVASHDITVGTSDADDLPLGKAIVQGLKRRAESGGQPRPIYIHTSGTGVVTSKPTGKLSDALKVFNNNNVDDIASIAPEQPHRNVDLEIFAAGESGQLATYVIAPSTIYDVGHANPVNKISQQVPTIVRTALERGHAAYIGEGTNLWNGVSIDDTAELYVLVFRYALKQNETPAPPAHKFSNFFFGSGEAFAWGDIARAVGKSLHARGLLKSPEATSVEPGNDFFTAYTGSNSRSNAERSRTQLGWKPKSRSIFEALEDDVEAVLKRDGRI
ncbi:hypothetical protein BOTBODRAFT_25650 [Botryobasidium botryosum FD-172 SS1]|uniref:NmrA-like domain-containing protein n=1 Tax=Botryobasidium botryosum (strain FD-172 SS1) TaxID=930990 RepID=A0A067N026_BOTB1|nr:hypothetical protein BOTBODRAFT_25650 [Botryobasidium botryosum FD-172 SS1]